MPDRLAPQVTADISPKPSLESCSTHALAKLRDQLLLLHRVGNELAVAESFDVLCRQAVVRGGELTGHRRMSFWFRVADSMKVTGTFGVDEQGQIRDERAQTLTVSPHSSMGQVLTHQHPLLIKNNCPLLNHQGAVVGHGAHVIAALWNGARVTGCLCMDNLLDQQPIVEADCDLLKLFAATLGHLAFRKQAEDGLKKALREKDVLLREIHHRVKNNLQVMSSLLSLQSGRARDPYDAELFRQSQNRIKSMAKVYETLCGAEDLTRVNIQEYILGAVRELFDGYHINAASIHLRMDCGRESLSLTQAVPCGLIVNELVTNALKHGFNCGKSEGHPRKGEISIVVRRKDEHLSIAVGNNGAPFPPDVDLRKPSSLGLQLVNALVAQLQGNLALSRDNGTVVTVTFPVRQEEVPLANTGAGAGG